MKVLLLNKENIAPATSIPYGFFPKAFFKEYDLTSHILLRVEHNKRRINFVAMELESIYASEVEIKTEDDIKPNHFFIPTFRLKKLLNINKDCLVDLIFWDNYNLEVKPSLIDDFPKINEVDVSEETHNYFKKNKLYPYLVHKHIVFPIKLRKGKYLAKTQIRLSLSTRVLINPHEGKDRIDKITLSGFRKSEQAFWFPRKNYYSYQTIKKEISSFIKRFLNLPAVGLELILEPIISAPTIFLRTTEPFEGDDHQPIVRIHEDCFNLLGISPGDEVILGWVNRSAVAIALKFGGLETNRGEMFNESKRRVETFWRDVNIPIDHLTIGMSATLRAALGIPRYTIVSVRRRVMTIFLKKFNEFLIPFVGLSIAGAAIPGFQPIYYLYGAIISIVFVLVSIRKWSTPKGIWP